MNAIDVVIVREPGGTSESGEPFPDIFVAMHGGMEDCIIKGEQPALWRFFDQVCGTDPRRLVPLPPFGQLGVP